MTDMHSVNVISAGPFFIITFFLPPPSLSLLYFFSRSKSRCRDFMSLPKDLSFIHCWRHYSWFLSYLVWSVCNCQFKGKVLRLWKIVKLQWWTYSCGFYGDIPLLRTRSLTHSLTHSLTCALTPTYT